MKKLLLIIVLFVFSVSQSKAQFVTIPDSNFVNCLKSQGLSGCFNGNILDVTCPAVLQTTYLNCSGKNIYDLSGVNYFNNLIGLIANNNHISSIANLPNGIEQLQLNNNFLSIPPSNYFPASLKGLGIGSNQLFDLNLLNLTKLTSLYCGINNLNENSLKLPNKYINYLNIENNEFTFLNENNCNNHTINT